MCCHVYLNILPSITLMISVCIPWTVHWTLCCTPPLCSDFDNFHVLDVSPSSRTASHKEKDSTNQCPCPTILESWDYLLIQNNHFRRYNETKRWINFWEYWQNILTNSNAGHESLKQFQCTSESFQWHTSQTTKSQQASKQIPKTPYLKQRPSILKRNFKIKIGNILRIGERTPKYWTDSQKNNGQRSLRGSGMKAKLCKNHICVISKEDTGRDCGKNATCSSEGQFWVSIEIMRQMVEINKGWIR